MYYPSREAKAVVLFVGMSLLLGGLLVTSEAEEHQERYSLNMLLHEDWRHAGLMPVSRADDATFLRRVKLDLTGRTPTLAEIQQFTSDKSPNKRSALVRQLLDSEEYGDMMAMRYADIFRVKSEAPINLWPNAVQLYHRYLREAALQDRPFQELAHEMLTASGSNFRVAPANYFRAVPDHTPEGVARITAMTWLGLRLEKMPTETTTKMAPFFSCIGKKSTAEWKEEIIYTEPKMDLLTAATPDGTPFSFCPAEIDPRKAFADWLIEDRSLQFSKVWVNRAWHWLFGVPLSGEQPDDMPVPTGWYHAPHEKLPRLNEKLLTRLAQDFHDSGGKMKLLLEKICLCDAYQADWKTKPDRQQKAEEHFAVYPVHRIEAEVVIDILADLTGKHEKYRSVIPEPFTILPPNTRAIQVADGSISSSALGTFGRPPRDSGAASERNNAVTGAQRLYLMNSGILYRNLDNFVKQKLIKQYKQEQELINACYLLVLSRRPTAGERQIIHAYAEALPPKGRNRTLALDILWSLINGKEFLYHH